MPYTPRHMRVPRPARSSAALLIGAVALGSSAGCQQVLFPRKEPRTQYEQYDRMRQRNAPIEEPDVFGNPQPALRQRLSQPTV